MLASDDEVMSKPRYYTALALLIFGGIAAASIDLHQFPKTERAIHALADALIIAPLLAITVDTYLKKWLLKEASFDIFQFMLGYTLPRGITDRLKAIVEGTALIRRECELRWTLTWVDENKNGVLVRLVVTYFVENLTQKDRTYTQRALADDPNDPDTKVEAIWCHCWTTAKDYKLEGAALVQQKPDESGDRWIFGPQFVIPFHNREREMQCQFGGIYSSKAHLQDDDQYSFTEPTLNVRVVVEAPPELVITVDPTADRCHFANRYEYSKLFVDNESIAVRWRKHEGD